MYLAVHWQHGNQQVMSIYIMRSLYIISSVKKKCNQWHIAKYLLLYSVIIKD